MVSDLCGPELSGKEDNVEIACHGLLRGIALHRATQHVQIAGILVKKWCNSGLFSISN